MKSQEFLWSTRGIPGMEYLTQTRKISHEVIKKFKLGFVPSDSKHNLAGRIIYPIEDASGNLVIISTRLIDSSKTLLPVHWHERYEKSFYLYGMSCAKDSIRNNKFCIVVEGQGDVLQLHNHGFTNTVGLGGNKMSLMQIASICRYCEEIILLLDKDANRAGQNATERILEDFGSLFNDNMVPVQFPTDTDPDEYILRFGADSLSQLINSKLSEIRENK